MNTKLLDILVEAGLEVEVFASSGPALDIFELCAAAREIQHVHTALEPDVMAQLIPDTIKERIVYPSVIFSSHGGARGRQAGVPPFSQFLSASGLVRMFTYKSANGAKYIGYASHNWEYVFLCSNSPDFSQNLGRCMLVHLDPVSPLRRANGPMSMRQFQSNLARFAENVPGGRSGLTRAGKQADARATPAAAPKELPELSPMTKAELAAKHLSLEDLKGSSFRSVEEFKAALEAAVAERYGTCLL